MFWIVFSLFSNINHTAGSTLDWVFNNESDFDTSLGICSTIDDNPDVNMSYYGDWPSV